MKRNMMTISAMAASLLIGTAGMAYAQSNSNGMMKSGDNMSSGSMKSGSMKSGDKMMKSDSMSSGGSMKGVKMVGGAPMYPSKNVVENASKAKNLTTLVAAVKQAGLVSTLEGKGPFTVFAPTNNAFAKLPKSTVNALMQPENKDKLTKILTYHVVPGDYTVSKLKHMMSANHGEANLTTVEGEPLTVKMSKGHMVVIDKKGGGARIITANVKQSNGVAHVIGSVLMP